MGEIELGAAAEATIQAYKELATDPSKRLALALDRTCIQFLAYVVAEGEGSLVQSAVDTLALIAEAKECRPSLANTFGVLESLQSITEDEERYSEALREKAAGLFTSLQFAKHVKNSGEPKERSSAGASSSASTSTTTTTTSTTTSTSTSTTSTSSSSSSTATSSSHSSTSPTTQAPPVSSFKPTDDIDSSRKTGSETPSMNGNKTEKHPSKLDNLREMQAHAAMEKRDSFLGIHNSKAKIVTLFIKGMVNQEQRQRVEEELVRVRGLISIVFDLGHSRVTCRVKRDLSVEKLAAAVARTETFAAQQVTTNDKGEEEIIPLGQTPTETYTTSPVEDLPDYLPEEDIGVKDANSAMAPSGSFMETASSWISSASSLLQKSFYW